MPVNHHPGNYSRFDIIELTDFLLARMPVMTLADHRMLCRLVPGFAVAHLGRRLGRGLSRGKLQRAFPGMGKATACRWVADLSALAIDRAQQDLLLQQGEGHAQP